MKVILMITISGLLVLIATMAIYSIFPIAVAQVGGGGGSGAVVVPSTGGSSGGSGGVGSGVSGGVGTGHATVNHNIQSNSATNIAYVSIHGHHIHHSGNVHQSITHSNQIHATNSGNGVNVGNNRDDHIGISNGQQPLSNAPQP